MRKLSIMNRKEIKELLKMMNKQWGYDGELDYAFLRHEDGRIFLAEKDFAAIDVSRLNINSLGMYFAEVKHNEMRVSIEGSQVIGKDCSKNVVELNDEETADWMRGDNVKKETDAKGFVLIKNSDDFLGCGKYKEGKILNFVPKERRINKKK